VRRSKIYITKRGLDQSVMRTWATSFRIGIKDGGSKREKNSINQKLEFQERLRNSQSIPTKKKGREGTERFFLRQQGDDGGVAQKRVAGDSGKRQIFQLLDA